MPDVKRGGGTRDSDVSTNYYMHLQLFNMFMYSQTKIYGETKLGIYDEVWYNIKLYFSFDVPTKHLCLLLCVSKDAISVIFVTAHGCVHVSVLRKA